jgi:hypothetical protein
MANAGSLRQLQHASGQSFMVPLCNGVAFAEGYLINKDRTLLHLGEDHFVKCSTTHAITVLERRHKENTVAKTHADSVLAESFENRENRAEPPKEEDVPSVEIEERIDEKGGVLSSRLMNLNSILEASEKLFPSCEMSSAFKSSDSLSVGETIGSESSVEAIPFEETQRILDTLLREEEAAERRCGPESPSVNESQWRRGFFSKKVSSPKQHDVNTSFHHQTIEDQTRVVLVNDSSVSVRDVVIDCEHSHLSKCPSVLVNCKQQEGTLDSQAPRKESRFKAARSAHK